MKKSDYNRMQRSYKIIAGPRIFCRKSIKKKESMDMLLMSEKQSLLKEIIDMKKRNFEGLGNLQSTPIQKQNYAIILLSTRKLQG